MRSVLSLAVALVVSPLLGLVPGAPAARSPAAADRSPPGGLELRAPAEASGTPGDVWRVVIVPSLAATTAFAAPEPAPPPAPSPRLAPLEARLEALVASHPEAGRVALAVTDLETGETVSVNGSRPQFAGCTVNMLALILVLRDVHEGRYPLDSVAGLIERTVRYSDPVTARELYRIAGGGDVLAGVRRAAEEVGGRLPVAGINLDHPPAFLAESIGGGRSNLVTAEALNGLMAALYRGDLLAEPERSLLLDTMATVYPGLSYLLGVLEGEDGVSVHHKNGFFLWLDGYVDNDTGIVQYSRAGGARAAFAITFLAEGVPTEFGDVPLGQAAARLALEFLSGLD